MLTLSVYIKPEKGQLVFCATVHLVQAQHLYNILISTGRNILEQLN